MKKLNTTFTGGAPLKQKALEFLQSGNLETLRAIIEHFGIANVGSFIISGCEVVGTNITAGMMYIDGDLCPFAGAAGIATTKIKKNTVLDSPTYKNGSSFAFYETITAQINTAGVPLNQFTRIPKIDELINEPINWADVVGKPQVVIDPYNSATVPAELTVLQRLELLEKKNAVFQEGGGMVLWNKPLSLIPWGWHEVVDWKGRIPVGVDNRQDAIGNALNPEFQSLPNTSNDVIPGKTNIGGKTVTLEIRNMPPHNHSLNGLRNYTGNNSPNTPGNYDQSAGGGLLYTDSVGGESVNGQTLAKPFSILNPYRTALFIEWTGLP